MSKKLLTKLLAFVMSAGLVMQPLAVYAAESDDADLIDPVVEEVEEEVPELKAEYNVNAELPAIQNVYIEDGIMYWDPFPNAEKYVYGIGNLFGSSTTNNSLDLYATCTELQAQTGYYEITITAWGRNNDRIEIISQKTSTSYYYESPTTINTVKSVIATSDIDEVLVNGGQVKNLTLTITSDDVTKIEFNNWQKLEGDNWNTYNEDTFAPGTYRFFVALFLKDGHYSDNELDNDVTLTIDGVEYTVYQRNYSGNGSILCTIYNSKGFEIEDSTEPEVPNPGEQIPISTIEVDSNYAELAKYGAPMTEADFDISEDDPIEVKGDWTVMTGEDEWSFSLDSNRTFDSGSYRYQVDINVADWCHGMYYLDEDFKFRVNGENWTRISSDDGRMTFVSETIEIEAPENLITIIPSVETSSNIADIFINDNDLVFPEFDNSDSICEIACHWIEKNDGGGFHPINAAGKVTPGTYRVSARVTIRSGIDDFALSEATKLIIDDEEWKYRFALNSDDIYVFAAVYDSPEIVIKDIPIAGEGEWVTKRGATYYVYPGGFYVTGMYKIDDDYYLFSQNGKLQKNVFYEEEGNRYFFGEDGKMLKGWFDRWGATYYSGKDGAIQTGFVEIGEYTYYFDSKGKQSSSIWVIEDGKRYYIKADGHMAKSETIHRWGKEYSFGEDGALIN